MKWCLLPKYTDAFKRGLRSGEIDPQKLASMESETRNKFLGQFVGKENASQVNALFESKLLLKNQKAGMITWAKRVGGMTPEAKRDLISRIEKMDKVLNPKEGEQFFKDLAESKLGVGVSETEAKNLFDLTTKIKETKTKANPEGIFPNKDDKLSYGMSQVNFEKYMNELKLRSRNITFKEQPVKYVFDQVGKVPGLLKSFLSSLDDSFFGRQGIKTLADTRTSKIWVKNFLKSFRDIGRELKGTNAMDAVKADIYSRPNALNGKYKAGGYGLDVLSEEAFPSSLPGRIPLLGRLYKASESAYNGGALRMRADLADRYIKIAEKQGIDTLNPDEAKPLGNLIGSLTGRGNLGKGEVFAKETNLFLFSVKFLKANFDTLFAPARYAIGKAGKITGVGRFKNKGAEFASKEAAKSTLSIIASISSVLATAKLLDPNSVEEDPRSTNFGKVKIFGRWTDITGGMAPMATLAMRLMPTYHNGKWGFWSKDKSGGFKDLTGGKYGQDDALDTFENFFEGKLSPALGLVRDLWKGKTYQGDPLTPLSAAKKSVVPITGQTFGEMMKDPNSSNIIASTILELFGFSSAPETYPTNWNSSTSKELTQLKERVGPDKFKSANDQFNRDFAKWFATETKTDKFKGLNDEAKLKAVTDKKEELKQKIFKQYNFKPKQAPRQQKKSGSLFK